MEGLDPCQRVLVVIPHPDDGEIGCGGTVARLVREGKEVVFLLMTNGDKGTEDVSLSPEALARIRREEQREAARALGVQEVVFLEHGDGELETDRATLGELVYHIRRLKPDIVLTNDPFRRTFYIHRDHRHAGLLTIDAVFPYARDRLHFPEHLQQGLTTHKVAEVFFWGAEDPDVYVDIGETLDLKVRALTAHKSQFPQVAEDEGRFGKWMREWAARNAEGHGMQYAESFRQYGIRRLRFEEEEEKSEQ